MVRLFRELEPAEILFGAGDPGNGVSYSAGVYISHKHRDIPLVFHARRESPQFGIDLNNIGLYMKKKTGDFPLLAVERNIGQGTIEKLRDLGYPLHKLYRQKSFDRLTNETEERIGWTTTSGNRRKMLDSFAMAIRNKEIKIYDEVMVSEMLTFILNEKTGEPRPQQGTFSDLIMAGAICYQLLDEIPLRATWHKEKQETNSRFLPEKAEGFINEDWQPPERDWRSA